MSKQQAAIPTLSARFDLATLFLRRTSSALCGSLLALLLSVAGAHAGTSSVPEVPAQTGPVGRTDLSHPSAAQSEEMRSRIELTRSIVQNVAADAAGKGANQAWRVGLSSVLYATSSTTLRQIAATASTLDQAHAMARADLPHGGVRGIGANSLGSTSDSLVFTPITPCRFIDTRNVGGGITIPRQFDTSLDAGTYGGATGCKLPAGGEASIAVNVTIVVAGTAVAGYLGIRPVGSTALTSFINWPTGGTQGWANAGIVSTARNGSGNYAFEVFASNAGPDLIVDYFGYFSGGPAGTANQTVRYDDSNALVANPLLQAFADGGLLAGGTLYTGSIPATGAGMRLMWYPAKGAFRAGSVTGSKWDDSVVGYYSSAMGYNTTASGNTSTAMGDATIASNSSSTAMGSSTTASGGASTAMGNTTIASGPASTAMGYGTIAIGNISTAMVYAATAQHDDSFIWNGDIYRSPHPHTDNPGDFYVFTGGAGRALFSASGIHDCYLAATGTAGWQCSSDRNLKTAIVPTDGLDVLAKLIALPVSSWEFKKDPGPKHLGPMAQDFKAAFGLGGADDKSIGSTDAQGVALAAIKGLNAKLEQVRAAKDKEIAELRHELTEAKAQALAAQSQAAEAKAQVATLASLAGEVAALKSQFRTLERSAQPLLTAGNPP